MPELDPPRIRPAVRAAGRGDDQVVAVKVMLDRLLERAGVDLAEVAGVAYDLRAEPLVCELVSRGERLAFRTGVDHEARPRHPIR